MNFEYLIEESFYEENEVERTIKDLKLKNKKEEIIELFKKVKPIPLKKEIWDELENTDNDVKTIKDVKERLKEYERPMTNYEKVKKSKWFPPLIIHFTSKKYFENENNKMINKYYLVAGNTRLMVSKVNNSIPTVKIIEL
jgi:hypothetical protein